MRLRPFFLFALVLNCFGLALSVGAQQTVAPAAAQNDPILKAMLAELDRNQKRLQLENAQKPYFIEFRIDEVTEYHAGAEYGALTEEHETHSRVAHVRVRVGDYKFDNSHPANEATGQIAALMRMMPNLIGDGMFAIETVDDDPDALRFGLWSASDTAYKRALEDYAKKQAELKTVATPPQVSDFAQEKPFVDLEPVKQLLLDREAWKKAIVEGSGLNRTDPVAKAFAAEVETANGTLQARVRTTYLVNSEGSILRKSYSEYHAEVAFDGQAADGARVGRSAPQNGTTAEGLGDVRHFHDVTLSALKGLDAQCHAPTMTGEYHGPVLLAGNAAARTFDDIFAPAVLAKPPAMGSTARTTGAFASSYQSRVLPDGFSMVDDPSLTTFGNKPLIGAYKVDDEGVPAQRVMLVTAGKLSGYLLGRDPVRDFPVSNGHGRAASGQAPTPRVGVLQVQANETVSDDELLKKLIAMGKDRGLESVYLVETLGDPSSPRTLYRIKVSDGTRELVRGARLGDLDLRTLRSNIVAVGDKPYVLNSFGDIPYTVIAPPMLIDDATVKARSEKTSTLPPYPPPS